MGIQASGGKEAEGGRALWGRARPYEGVGYDEASIAEAMITHQLVASCVVIG